MTGQPPIPGTDADSVSAPTEMQHCIELRDVTYQPSGSPFRLSIPQFDVAPRQRIAITGRSGSGKTTLLRLLSGQVLPESGQVEVFGTSLPSLTVRQRELFRLERIGIVFQEFRLIEYLSVADNLRLVSLLQRQQDTGDEQDRIERIASQLGIAALLKRRPRELSQGERQRVAIGRALFNEPDLILADEPTGNLDNATAGQSLEYLFAAAESCNATLLVVTHDLTQLSRFDRSMPMDELNR